MGEESSLGDFSAPFSFDLSGENKVEGPLEEGGKGDIDGDGIPDSEDENPRVPDSEDDDEGGEETGLHSSAQGGFG